jgi:hypothetical protein
MLFYTVSMKITTTHYPNDFMGHDGRHNYQSCTDSQVHRTFQISIVTQLPHRLKYLLFIIL